MRIMRIAGMLDIFSLDLMVFSETFTGRHINRKRKCQLQALSAAGQNRLIATLSEWL